MSNLELVKFFIEKKADIHHQVGSEKLQALHFGVRSCSPDILRLLLHKGADINAKTASGETPLHIACKHCLDKSIKVLLEFRAKINV